VATLLEPEVLSVIAWNPEATVVVARGVSEQSGVADGGVAVARGEGGHHLSAQAHVAASREGHVEQVSGIAGRGIVEVVEVDAADAGVGWRSGDG